MGNRWVEKSLGDVIELKRGYDLPAISRRPGPYPIVSSSGIADMHSAFKAKAPGVVTGRYGTIGSVYYIKSDYWPLNTSLYVRDFKGNDPRFVFYLLQSIDFVSYSDKSAVPGVNRNHLHQALVRVPTLKIQHRISKVLGKLDDKIELNRRMNRTLEKMAAAIFKSWFIDFDPVHAKAEGRDPNLPAEIANLFPDSFEDSELGTVPKGWAIRAIGDVVKCVGGATPRTENPEFWQCGVHPFVTPKDMSSLQSPVIIESERHLTDAGVENISSKQLPEGTVLLSSRAPIGYLAVTDIPVSVNQGIIAMLCNGELPNLYVLHWTRSNMDLIKSRAGGTTFAEISKQSFRPIPIMVPNSRLLKHFMEIVAPIHGRITRSVREIRHLVVMRDKLLPKLLSGEIIVPAELAAEEMHAGH